MKSGKLKDSDSSDKTVKSLTSQLEKERAKNKLLQERLKENSGGGEDVIFVGPEPPSKKNVASTKSATQSMKSAGSFSILSSMGSSFASSHSGEEDDKIVHLNKKIRVYRYRQFIS